VKTTNRIGGLLLFVGIAAIGCLGATPAEARLQPPRDASQEAPATAPNRADPSDPRAPVSTGELVNMLDTYAIVRAQTELTLTDTQYAQFVTRLKRLQEARRRNQRERNQILQDLRRLTGPLAPTPIDEGAVRERLRALRDHDERAAAEMRKAYETLDEVLDVRQQARFRIFEETIERRKLDLVMRARERANRSGRGGQ
jgi:septal ring factor EnvC (AmiA/AmiB activator)